MESQRQSSAESQNQFAQQPQQQAAQKPRRTPGQLGGIFLRILRGQLILTFGLVLIYLANLGVAPWDLFSIGISYHTPLQYGTALNAVGISVILIDLLIREKVGLTTIQDALLSGFAVDFWVYLFRLAGVADTLLGSGGAGNAGTAGAAAGADAGAEAVGGFAVWFDGLSGAAELVFRIALFIAGVLVTCLGQLFVQREGMGAGPRDTLVLGLGRKVPKVPIGVVTWSVLALVFTAGVLLGGPVGIGTIASVFGMGLGQQLMCRIFHFEPRAVRHENILETVRSLRKDGEEADGAN